ncbi:hypothetical protein HMPREF0530_1903 [Lacticaseibacillus paracasei subsp. paracasei ATCC 25302 = DSM 5622 = JCM 8130]|nr:hypothetical protein HMPREF0530_1903 [Lacticaseibacillus paracasei subsp. paracasei ATCC 25302 = DSM 5622 = JCM 8130]
MDNHFNLENDSANDLIYHQKMLYSAIVLLYNLICCSAMARWSSG